MLLSFSTNTLTKLVRFLRTVLDAWSSKIVWNLFISWRTWLNLFKADITLGSSLNWRLSSQSELANKLEYEKQIHITHNRINLNTIYKFHSTFVERHTTCHYLSSNCKFSTLCPAYFREFPNRFLHLPIASWNSKHEINLPADSSSRSIYKLRWSCILDAKIIY